MIAGIIGATGYAGAELTRILASHPKVDNLILSSVSFEGEKIEDVYPNFFGKILHSLVKADDVIAAADVVFSALPQGAGEPYAKACIDKNKPFIDLSADFRFGENETVFRKWYDKPWQYPELRKYSVYGLPELNRGRIRELAASGKLIVGNPGCYPTGASLGVFPALAKGLCNAAFPVIVNSVSGISGGGREPARSFHYPECADSVSAYKVGCHRHTPEIERNFSEMAARGSIRGAFSVPAVVFTPHLAPMNRGILSTIYIPLAAAHKVNEGTGRNANEHAIHSIYSEFYKDEPFVRVLPCGITAASNRVRQSNFCDISVHLDHSGAMLIIITAIDNMVKGAAGQAIQNMNIIFDFDETASLEMISSLF
jgi:N-acetyl-gamma-glutamyl-phosphate reductase